MNLRQYRPSTIVQAARVVGVGPAHLNTVEIKDVDGNLITICQPGLLEGRKPPSDGDWLLFFDGGRKLEFVETDVFDTEWEPVSGPFLS